MDKERFGEVKEKYKNGGVYYLDGGYTVFGQVVDGFDVIDSISGVECRRIPAAKAASL